MVANKLPWWRQEDSGYGDDMWLVFEDFRNFLWLCWSFLDLPDPTTVQYDIAEYLQYGPKRLVIEAFRGVGKSWITAALVCWLLLRDPQLNILVVSGSKNRADDFSTFTLQLIRGMPLLNHLEPHSDQRNSKVSFDVAPAEPDQNPSVKSVGITGQITGSRADLIISDDVETLNNSQTQGQRDKLSETIKEFDAVLKPGGRVVYLGTPQTEMSIYNLLPERGYIIRIWPGRFPTQKQQLAYAGALAPLIVKMLEDDPSLIGKGTDTERFTEEDLLEREASFGPLGWALQFMLDTRLSDVERYPLKLSDLIVMPCDADRAPEVIVWASGKDNRRDDLPNVGLNGDFYHKPMAVQGEFSTYTGCVLVIDPSGRGKDETAYCVIKMLHGYLFLVEAGGFSGGYTQETLEALANAAKRHKANQVIIESNFGDGMFTALLEPLLARIHPCSCEEVRHSVQKERRIIDTLEPVMNQHRLVVDESVIQKDYISAQERGRDNALNYQLFYQMSRITRDRGALRQDDRLDALAIGVNYWVEQMGQDAEKAAQANKDERLHLELEKFMQHTIGGGPKRPNWYN